MREWFSPKPGQPDWMKLSGIDLRKIIRAFMVLALIALVGWLLRPQITQWHHARLLAKAREFIAAKDFRSGVLVIRDLLARDPDNVAASRLMADLAQAGNARAVVQWRTHLTELEPTDANFMDLADVAMRFNENRRAGQALEKVSPAGQALVTYKKSRSALAMLQNQWEAAEPLLRDIVRLEPGNATNALNLAIVLVSQPGGNHLAEAFKMLETLRTNPAVQLNAMRALALACERQRDTNRALVVFTQLAGYPDATMGDKVQWLERLRRSQSPEFTARLAAVQAGVRKPDDVLKLESWMSPRGMAREAEVWIESLPSTVRQAQPIQLALAEALVIQQNWPLLEELTRSKPWPEQDFLRLAMHARALRARGDRLQSRKAWQAAVTEAGGGPQSLGLLVRAAEAWGWEAELEEVRWALALAADDPKAELRALQRLYTERGNTRQLLRVHRRVLEIAPDDRLAKNNVAMFMLLLRDDIATGARLAKENIEVEPANEIFISTHAFALLSQNNPAGALEVMGRLPEKLRNLPEFAGYYGAMLAAAGQTDLAVRYLQLGDKARSYLPEEKAMLAEARKKLR